MKIPGRSNAGNLSVVGDNSATDGSVKEILKKLGR
jgi:hypothetical protein